MSKFKAKHRRSKRQIKAAERAANRFSGLPKHSNMQVSDTEYPTEPLPYVRLDELLATK